MGLPLERIRMFWKGTERAEKREIPAISYYSKGYLYEDFNLIAMSSEAIS